MKEKHDHHHSSHHSNHVLENIKHLLEDVYSNSGQFIATGEHSITFNVKCNHRNKISVGFADDQHHPTCSPCELDTLLVQFTEQNGPFSLLTIYWKVSGVRKINWSVKL